MNTTRSENAMIRHREERRGCRVSGLRKSSLGFVRSLRAAFGDTSYSAYSAVTALPSTLALKSRYMNPAVSVNQGDCRAVSYPLEYVIISGIAILFFAVVMMTSGAMLTAAPLDVAATQQFNDVGNDISNKLIMFYLIVPEHGTMSTTLEMPQTIGGHAYTVRMSTNNTTDQTVVISADDLNVNISYTLNGIGASIPIDGETHSASGTHRLWFISTE